MSDCSGGHNIDQDDIANDDTQRLMRQGAANEGNTSPRYFMWLLVFALLAVVYYFLK